MKITETKYFCDICKKEIKDFKDEVPAIEDPLFFQKVMENKNRAMFFEFPNYEKGCVHRKEYLICKPCAKAISAFLETLEQSCN